MRRAELPPDSYSAAVLYFTGNGKHTFVISQEIASCEIKSLRRGAHCPVDNGFAPTETECRLRSSQRRSLLARGTKAVLPKQ